MSIAERYSSVRTYTETLMSPLSIEDHLSQPTTDVSPPKWHLGHTTWFFETFLLKKHYPNYQVFDEQFNYLFNSYYEAVGDRLLRDMRGSMTRPSLEKVKNYRAYVNEHMHELLEKHSSEDVLQFTELGLQHEQQHQELFLTDFKVILNVQPFHPVYDERFKESLDTAKPKKEFTKIEAGLYSIGFEGNGFCFDNELGRHQVYLNDFEISNSLITNKEWLAFMNDGGYEDPQHWHSQGWAWVKENNIVSPKYWEQSNGDWHRFALSGLEKLNPNDAVAHISYYEAYAYAEWCGMRLPTEFEWEVASDCLNWGQRWEWTNSAYLPYPKFEKAEGAVGEYNGKFMVNQMVLRGSSVATSPGHSRKTYRNFFHAPLRWQFTGLRLAKR